VGLHQSKVAAMLLLTLRGTPTLYYGDEIGMCDVPVPFDEVQYPQGKNMPDKNLSRDPARTPMQWDKSKNAGFTEGKPWLPLDTRYQRNNVESQKSYRYSMLSYYIRIITLRENEECLKIGSFRPVHSDRQLIAYCRQLENHPEFLIVLNLSHRPCYFKTNKINLKGKIEVATSPELEGTEVEEALNLSGDEGVIIRLSN
jgi:alpha-glucosidase